MIVQSRQTFTLMQPSGQFARAFKCKVCKRRYRVLTHGKECGHCQPDHDVAACFCCPRKTRAQKDSDLWSKDARRAAHAAGRP